MDGRPANSMDQEQDSQNQRPSSVQKPARELKVEDALLYLDQVKMEFSDKPQIYNEFLDIMKNFKAQSINTPGVIERVKNLFRGYNKLILGFNTFLPEGEGYKIELTAEEQAFNHPGQEVPAPHSSSSVGSAGVHPGGAMGAAPMMPAGAPGPHAPPMGQPGPGFGNPNGAAPYYGGNPAAGGMPGQGQMPPAAGAPPMQPGQGPPAGAGAGGPGAPGAAQAQQPGQMQQAHAIHYVTKIRNRFSTEPDTYRSFLKILHTYQKEQKGIKEVLEQVSQLFADHPDLLMEFTYFLPDAVQEQAKERLHRAARESEARRIARMQSAKNQGGRKGQGPTMNQGPMRGPNGEMMGPMMGQMMGQQMMMDPNMGGQMGPQGMAGNKRSRADRDAMRAAAAGVPQGMTPAQQQNYAMQLAAAGLDDPQGLRKGMMGMQMANGYGMPNQPNVPGGPPKKVNRRKNAAVPPGMIMMADGSLMNVGPGGMDMKNQGVGGLSQHHQMMLLQQQQQALAHQLQLQQHQQQQQAMQRSKESLMSVSAERRYFEQVKEVLTATSRETWQEFVKVLELFSNDAVSKEDMLDLIGDLFGPQHNDLFHEYKRLLSSREEYDEHKSDVWYAVPLSEIDFTQCRKCTPSYRALPKDYPKAKCTERSEEEARMLNDQWVSIPIGSEESYSFKHMRKNQYEEALFKVEDERFEIDMVIDSNMCTIRVLEPLAEEIQHMKQIETLPRGAGQNGDAQSGAAALGASSASIAPRFSFQLEKRHLSTIHLNSIARIYGDHGEEILELLRRNPAGTIPVLLKRLKQKDLEWRKARTELNKHWKEVVEKNHIRSFDHRSFYFRQQDKKYMSTRQLVTEITALASPQSAGSSSGPANSSANNDANAAFEDSENTGLFPKVTADAEGLLAGMAPHIVLNYDNDAHLVHRDIYRIMCHAAETTLTSSVDKERLAALWRDLLRVFFNIPVHYLYSAAPGVPPSATASSTASASSVNGDTVSDTSAMNVDVAPVPAAAYKLSAADAWPAHTKVITTYGSGEVLGYREEDGMYSVRLPFGIAFLSPSSVHGSEQLSSNALYVIGVTPSEHAGEPDTIYNGLVNTTTSADADKSSNAVRDPSKLFYGTQMCYIFMRLHHAMYVRLRIAKQLAAAATQSNRYGAGTQDEEEGPSKRPVYNYFLSQVQGLVEGSVDNARFEEFCRTLLGNKSYVLYTLDKLIAQAVKHLQAMANDENVTKLVGLFIYHHHHDSNSAVGAVDPVVYRDHVSCILSHTMEDVFRIQLMASPDAGTSAGISQVGVQHLGILVPPQQTTDAAADSAMLTDETPVASEPAAVLRQSSATFNTFNTSLRARGGSLASVTGMDAALVATAGPRLTVAGKTPKAVVSDDEEEGSDSGEDDAMEQDADEDADTDDAMGLGASTATEVNTRQGLYSPTNRRSSLGEFPDK